MVVALGGSGFERSARFLWDLGFCSIAHRVPYAFCFNGGSASFHGSASLGLCLTPLAQQTNHFSRHCSLSIHFEQLEKAAADPSNRCKEHS